MQYFNVCHLVRALDLIDDSTKRCLRVIEDSMGIARDQLVTKDIADHIGPILIYLRTKCLECELSNAVQRIDERIVRGFRDGITFNSLLNQLTELRHNVDKDLELKRFIFIPSLGADFLGSVGHRWGAIWKVVPACEKDVREGTLCYALELPNAAVFHAMRVAEFGLRYLAAKMKVSLLDKGKKIPIEFGTWEKIISNCKNKIDAARKLPANEKKEHRLQYYSRAADHGGYMKDIWRNDISHTRKDYIDSEARAVLDRVHAFMEFLSAGSK